MLINVTGFSNGEVRHLDFSQQLEIPPSYSVSDNIMVVHILGSLALDSDGNFRFIAHVKSDFDSVCDLCLVSSTTTLAFDMDEVFSENPNHEDAWSFTGKTIELMPAVLSNVLLNLPVKVLCKSDCMGLCSFCGADLNFTDCTCDKSNIDPRWAGLRSLLNEKEV